MEGPTITLQDAIDFIDSGEIFSISFVKCDKKRGTGGELRDVRQAIKYRNQYNENTHPGQKPAPETPASAGSGHSNKRLIYELSTRSKISVYLRLITYLNGARVL